MDFERFFEKGTKAKKIKNIILLICLVIFIILIQFFIADNLTMMFCDFPCGTAEVKEGYIMDSGFIEFDESPNAFLLVTTISYTCSGGGCLKDSMNIGDSRDIKGYELTIVDDGFMVDGQTVTAGQIYEHSDYIIFTENPWYIVKKTIYLKNEGFIKGTKIMDRTQNYDKEFILIQGTAGTEKQFNYFTLIVFCLSILFPLSIGVMKTYYRLKKE